MTVSCLELRVNEAGREGFEPPIRLMSHNLPLTLSFDPAFSRRALDCQLTREIPLRNRGPCVELPIALVKRPFVVSCRLKFTFVGRSPVQVVPASPQLLQRLSKLFWNSLLPTAVKAESQSELSFQR